MPTRSSGGHLRAGSLLEEGRRLLETGKPAKAAALLARAAERDRDNPEILGQLGRALHESGRKPDALSAYERVIKLVAATGETWLGAGSVLMDYGEHARAIEAFEECLKLDGGNADAHHKLGTVLFRLGEVDKSMKHLQIATKYDDRISTQVSLANIVAGAPGANSKKILKLRRQCAQKLAGAFPPDKGDGAVIESGRRDRPRIGYLSAHFHRPNYMKPVWGMINHHDREQFVIHLFSDSPRGPKFGGYQRHREDLVHPVHGMENDVLAKLIRKCRIDVLVDLSGYSYSDRLPLFLGHPAPVVAGWFNAFATSGLPGFDYIIGDDEVVSPGEDRWYSEEVVRLPLSYLTFEVAHEAPPVVDPPCVRNGYLTFGSLISQYKMTPPVIDAWATVLRKTESRLVIANTEMKSAANQDWLKQRFADRKVDINRLLLLGPADHCAFLKYYDKIDVALDGFPYNGGTTTMEAIWQGVPVLTFAGDRWASRTSSTLLRRTHLGDFVARGPRSMVKRAIALARNQGTPEMLRKLRLEMRSALERSSACDTAALARALERLYAQWRGTSAASAAAMDS